MKDELNLTEEELSEITLILCKKISDFTDDLLEKNPVVCVYVALISNASAILRKHYKSLNQREKDEIISTTFYLADEVTTLFKLNED